MRYFDTLPKVVKTESNGRSTVYTNLLSRASLINNLLSDPTVFYEYDIQEGDTPEIVADKYYGDSYRYWLILLPNNILDPQWGWPLSGALLMDYINEKYTDPEGFHHYEKIVSLYESSTQITTTNTFEINEDAYNLLQELTSTYNFDSGTTTMTVTKKTVSNFEYEFRLNESKRKIKLLRKELTNRLEREFTLLMAE